MPVRCNGPIKLVLRDLCCMFFLYSKIPLTRVRSISHLMQVVQCINMLLVRNCNLNRVKKIGSVHGWIDGNTLSNEKDKNHIGMHR